MAKKLSPAQQRVLDIAREQVNLARSCSTYEEYFRAHDSRYTPHFTPEEYKAKWPQDYELSVRVWNRLKEGIVLTHASGPTIRKLEALGYIQIIEDATGTGSYTFDKVKLL